MTITPQPLSPTSTFRDTLGTALRVTLTHVRADCASPFASVLCSYQAMLFAFASSFVASELREDEAIIREMRNGVVGAGEQYMNVGEGVQA